ncbi:MAG TPA: type II toxin-antitoxin system VapC family toxin [Steroidobacteraceae bacterium]|nr:type II toxin-antitoxin system VapC family toxin [Steroidobacteraceae bacterium]
MNETLRRYLLDTHILADLIKNPSGRVQQRIVEVGEENICTSIIVACELRFGARKKNAPMLTARIERLLQTVEVLPLDGDVDRTYAEVRAMLEGIGRPSGANDMLIGAHALNEDCILVTNNESEFARITGLTVENWLAE